MTPDTKFEQVQGHETSETDDGYVICNVEADRVIFLNRTAATVLELCDGTRSVDDITARMTEGYGLDEDDSADVVTCLESLEREGLVRAAP